MISARYILGLLFAVLSFPSLLSAQATFYRKNERFPILTIEEFQKLRPYHQQKYMQDLQEFIVELDRVGVRTAWLFEMPPFLQVLFSLSEKAHAAAESCSFRISGSATNRYCFRCPSFNSISEEGGASPGVVCAESIDGLHSKLSNSQSAFPQVTLPDGTTNYAGYFRRIEQEEGVGETRVSSTVARRDGTFRTVVTPAGTHTVREPTNAEPRTVTEADPPTKIEKVENGQVTEVQANGPGNRLGAVTDTTVEASRTQNELRAAKEDFTKNLRCMYAGFPIMGRECSPRSHFKSDDGKTAYTCDLEGFRGSEEGKSMEEGATVKSPQPPNASKKVLCNPLIFGVKSNDEPFCIGRTKDATKTCLTLARADSESLKKAVALQNGSRKQARQLLWVLSKLCHGNQDELRNFLKDRSRNLNAAVADVATTCNVYGERFNEYFNQFNSEGGRSGRGSR